MARQKTVQKKNEVVHIYVPNDEKWLMDGFRQEVQARGIKLNAAALESIHMWLCYSQVFEVKKRLEKLIDVVQISDITTKSIV